MKASLNPLAYHPAQIAKALIAFLTSMIALLGLLAATLATGGLATAGAWIGGAAAVLTGPLVFLQKVQPWLNAIDPSGSARLAAGDDAANGGNAD